MLKALRLLAFAFVATSVFSCNSPTSNSETKEETATTKTSENATHKSIQKFEPKDGEVILFVGQELEAIGGLNEYNNGYFDHFGPTSGFTMYTKIRPGDEEFGYTHSGLSGLVTTDNWGDAESNMSLQVADEDFKNSALAIGLELVNHEIELANGEQDSLVHALGSWIKGLGDRPVFLRIGYEFNGHDWNHYDRDAYIKSFQRIKDTYDSLGIENVAYVWQSVGRGVTTQELIDWYPGDEYVDWCSYSFFAVENENHVMLDFARKHDKPVFLAEATPTMLDSAKQAQTIDMTDPSKTDWIWDGWFVPFFRTIDNNKDIVKAISYINAYWKIRPMWKENPVFNDVDARLEVNEEISKRWLEVVNQEKYLKPTDDLFEYLATAKK